MTLEEDANLEGKVVKVAKSGRLWKILVSSRTLDIALVAEVDADGNRLGPMGHGRPSTFHVVH